MSSAFTCFSKKDALKDLITFFKEKYNIDREKEQYDKNITNLKKVTLYCTKTIDNIVNDNNEGAKNDDNNDFKVFGKTLVITSELSQKLQNVNMSVDYDNDILAINSYRGKKPFILILQIFRKISNEDLAEMYKASRHNGSTYSNNEIYYLYFVNGKCYNINNINVNNYILGTSNLIERDFSDNESFLSKFGTIDDIESIKYKIIELDDEGNAQGGGKYSVKTQFKEVLGKKMRIYKIANSRKEHVKYKGNIIRLSEYRKLMEKKSNSKKVLKSKKAVATNKK